MLAMRVVPRLHWRMLLRRKSWQLRPVSGATFSAGPGDPLGGRSARERVSRSGVPLPKGWLEHTSSRGSWFAHEESGVTQWTFPTGPPSKEQVAALRRQGRGEHIDRLRPGAVVELRGLRSAPQLNGQHGTCEHWDHSSGWVRVRLGSGQVKAIKPENLFPREAFVDRRDEVRQRQEESRAKKEAAEGSEGASTDRWSMFAGAPPYIALVASVACTLWLVQNWRHKRDKEMGVKWK
mmetsp:Transcript_15205/g.29353  ORF Transcript_15205/g.29353 Transcript_15205/m.29353 type:complete len:236 (+) Transcript_15205:32-739(+)